MMTIKKTNKAVIAGVTAGLLAGGGFALVATLPGGAGASPSAAVAVTDDTTAPAGTDSTDDAHTQWLTDALQPLVDDETITPAQRDAVIAALEAAHPMGRGDHRGGMPGGPRMMGAGLQTVADTIGITVDELKTQLQSGQTVAEVAEANGSSAQAVIDALVAEAKAHFDEEVAAGEHTQAEVDARLVQVTAAITAMVNGEAPPMGDGMGPRGHGGWDDDGHRGMGGGMGPGGMGMGPEGTPEG